LLEGTVELAIMASPQPFEPRLDAQPLYREHFAVAYGPNHRFAALPRVTPADLAGECYLSRLHCEFQERLAAVCAEAGVPLAVGYESEREDWIQSMVAAGLGVCFLPEHSMLAPGLRLRRLADPEVVREVCIVSVAGRRQAPAVAAFVQALRAFPWEKAET
jgi:LysR family hydrogen peroxide-inducible transcriptional activator